MNAAILAAGVGRRLRPFTDAHPKCLLEFGRKTLIARHVENLAALGAKRILIVVGYRQEQVVAEVKRSAPQAPAEFVRNPSFELGSALSLLRCKPAFEDETVLLMDADILYCQKLLDKLLKSEGANGLLVDKAFSDTGEEVKVVGDESERVVELGKRVKDADRLIGESVGIFKVSPGAARALFAELQKAADSDPKAEYETVINSILDKVHFGIVNTGGLPWIEIDFAEDVERGRTEIWPAIQSIDAC